MTTSDRLFVLGLTALAIVAGALGKWLDAAALTAACNTIVGVAGTLTVGPILAARTGGSKIGGALAAVVGVGAGVGASLLGGWI